MSPEKANEEQGTDTVRVNITMNRELDKRFRDTVALTLGYKKGNLQLAIERALEDWIKEQQAKRKASKQ